MDTPADRTTRVVCRIAAARPAVYRALLDAGLVAGWMVPDDLSVVVHEFEPVDGGSFRLELVDPADPGLSGRVRGRFVRLVPDTAVVQAIRFEAGSTAAPDDAPDPDGEMTVVYALKDVEGGTELVCTQHPLPIDVDPADNAEGWRRSIARLAALVEARTQAEA